MDGSRFDLLARSLILEGSRRQALSWGLAGALVLLSSAGENAAARKKKPCSACKKRKKGRCKPKANGTACPGGTCQNGQCRCASVGLRELCTSDNDCCTSSTGMLCARTGGCRTDGLPVCCKQTGAPCIDSCDCCGLMFCEDGICT
jgi:hypothetical protein